MKSYMRNLFPRTTILFLAVMITMTFSMPGSLWSDSFAAAKQSVVSADEVDLMVSLSEDATGVRVTVPVSGKTPEELQGDIDDGKITLSLDRDSNKPYLDKDMYPNQKDGGELHTWKTQKPGGEENVFEVTDMAAGDEDGTTVLQITLNSKCYFYNRNTPDYSAPHTGGGAYLDICGYFNLNASVEGEHIGSASAKVTPYPSFHTMAEVYADIDAMEAYDTVRFVKKFSMGQSTGGRDMPYLIIAKDEKTVKDWLAYCDLVEKDPDAAMSKVGNVKAPVMYSNIHSNEIAAVDGILDFAWKLVKEDSIPYDYLTSFKDQGRNQLQEEMGPVGEEGSLAIPDLVKDSASYLGFLMDGNRASGQVDMEKYYNIDSREYDVDSILDDIFFIIVPEENVDGRAQDTREAANGYDLNRDNSFQTTPETANMQKLIGTYNPVSFTEFHGRVKAFQCEPCDPPHEPNFEYDLLAEHLIPGGEALGIGAVANNEVYNSYVIPQRDYLTYTGDGNKTYWDDPWDDMSTSYTPQFAMLHGTVAYTVELPAYSEDSTKLVSYGIIGNSAYVAQEKDEYLISQAKIYKRGVHNENSDAYDKVGQWFADQHDVEGAEMEKFRPEHKGQGENGNFYPEAYIIPVDRQHQKNLQAADDMLLWLTRNDVKVNRAKSAFKVGDTTYPAGTFIVPMYQAKRSVANGALNNGTLIDSWTILYSEGITAFNKTRGFDMDMMAKPAEYDALKGVMNGDMDYADVQKYVDGTTSSLEGITKSDADVIIENVSEDSTAAVNTLLEKGKTVGMITTEGKYKGDFVTSYENYLQVADKYRLTATGVYGKEAGIEAQAIKHLPKVYIVGRQGDADAGFVGTNRVVYNSYVYNYDKAAAKIMNFKQVEDPDKADVIMGGMSIRKDSKKAEVIEAVKNGTPYITYTGNGVNNAANFVEGTDRADACEGCMDCLAYVEYPENTLVNASYINEKDDIMYGYEAGRFTSIPEGAKVLAKVKNKTPLEGFVPTYNRALQEEFADYLDGGILGYEYTEGNLDLAVFAQTLTNKVHQRDEFQYISNFIFSRTLGDEYRTNSAMEQMEALERQLAEAKAKLAKLEKEKADAEAKRKAEEELAKAKAALVKAAQQATVKGLKAKSKKRRVTVSWKKTPGVTGYQVQFAKKGKKFVNLKAATAKTKVKTRKLSKKNKYVFRVRTYKTIDGKKIFGKWKTTKKVKIK